MDKKLEAKYNKEFRRMAEANVRAVQETLGAKTAAPEFGATDSTRSDTARMQMQNRNNWAGIKAGAQEINQPEYLRSSKFMQDIKRLTSQAQNGNLRGGATGFLNPAAGAMVAAANSRALTRLIPVIGQVAGAGMLGAAAGSGMYEANDVEIQDALAKLSGIDPATGLRGQQSESPGNILDRITETADEMIAQAKESTAVNSAWNKSQLPMGQKPQR